MGIVIDTSALVAIERGQIGLDETLSDVGDEAVVLPAIVYAELLAGVRLADTSGRASARRAKVDALSMRIPVVPFGTAAAERWAEIFAALQRVGTPINCVNICSPYPCVSFFSSAWRCLSRLAP